MVGEVMLTKIELLPELQLPDIWLKLIVIWFPLSVTWEKPDAQQQDILLQLDETEKFPFTTLQLFK